MDAEIDRRFRDMNQKIEALQNQAPTKGGSYNTDPSFSIKIMQEPLPYHFKMHQLECYEGLADLVDHLEGFKVVMLLHDAIDAVLYRILKGVAHHWYSTLKSRTIHSFDQMSHLFVTHFISSRR